MRMRRDLSAHPLQFGDRTYWGIKDPVSLRYYQLREEEYFILNLLDGQQSLESIRQAFEAEFAPRRIDIQQLQGFFGTLHRDGLVVTETAGQGHELLLRRKQARRQTLAGTFSNILAIRFRGLDPESFLQWLYPRCRWMFSVWCVSLCVLLMLAAAALVAVQFQTVRLRLPDFQAFFQIRNVVLLATAVAFSKVIHEHAHALTCKHFGGECHEMGFMLLAFTPCLYCNVSDSWMLPNKWHRVAVSAAGMYVELNLAAVCTFLWWFSVPGLLNSLCLNMVFVCSVSTLVFNGNPLLRYDGYFILADILEIPNLRQQSNTYARQSAARWFLGINQTNDRLLTDRRHGLLGAYFVASLVYRLFVIAAILWFVNAFLKPYGLEAIAQSVALVVLIGLVAVPVWQFSSFLADPTRNRLVKWQLLLVRGGVVAVAATLLCLLPLPYRIAAPVALEPQAAQSVYVSVPGTLKSKVLIGQPIGRGETLAELKNLDVRMQVETLRGQKDQQQLHISNLERRQVSDPGVTEEIPTAKERLADIEQRLHQQRLNLQRLTLTASITGFVLPPRQRTPRPIADELPQRSATPLEPKNAGSFLETGTMLCQIGDPNRLEAVLVIDQANIEFVRAGQRVRIQLDQLPGQVLEGNITEIAEIDLEEAPQELAMHDELPTRIDESGTIRPISTAYQARVKLAEQHPALVIGTTGRAKIHAAPQSLGRRLARYLARTFRFEL